MRQSISQRHGADGVRSYDVIINGGGLVGASLALALARNGWSVRLVEPNSAPGDWSAKADEWHPRVFAFAPRPWGWLERLGVTLPAERSQPVARMVVYGDRGGKIEFAAEEVPLPYLAVIAEAETVRLALWRALADCPTVEVAAGAAHRLVAVAWQHDRLTVTSAEGTPCHAALLVGAEGRNSWVRNRAGIAAETIPYDHHGVVANFATEKEHAGVAYQWFRDDGVLAYLPLPGNRVSIVWSTAPAHATELTVLDPVALAERVTAGGRHMLGRLRLITPPNAFPLSLLRCPRVIGHRVVVMGDAAHGIHPLSGHGVNLGLNDAATFAELLGPKRAGIDAGDPVLLVRYAQARFSEPFLLQTVTDALARGFGVRDPLVRRVRNAGMGVLNHLALLKRHLIRYATLAQW